MLCFLRRTGLAARGDVVRYSEAMKLSDVIARREAVLIIDEPNDIFEFADALKASPSGLMMADEVMRMERGAKILVGVLDRSVWQNLRHHGAPLGILGGRFWFWSPLNLAEFRKQLDQAGPERT